MIPSTKGYALSISAAFFSGLAVGIGKIVLTDADPQAFSVWIFAAGVPISFLWWWFQRDKAERVEMRPKSLFLMIIHSLLSAIAIVSMWCAVKMIDPTVASFLSRFEVLVVVIMGIWVFKERFKIVEAFGGAVIILGLIIIRYKAGIEVSEGMLLMIFSAVSFGLSEIIAKRVVRDVEPGFFAFVRNGIVLLFLLLIALPDGNYHPSQLGEYYYLVPLVGLFGPAMGRSIYLYALKYLEISKVATVNQAQPITVAIVAYFTLGMLPGVKEWVGGLIVISGCIIMIKAGQGQA